MPDKTAGFHLALAADRSSSDDGRSEPAAGRPVRFLKLTDVAEELNISLSQTYALVRSGELQGIQIGGRNQWRIECDRLELYIAQAYERTAEALRELPTSQAENLDPESALS